MIETLELKPSSYYLFKSVASGRSCYFESEVEIDLFKKLFSRYLSKFVKVQRMYLSTEGYHILLRVRDRDTLLSNYCRSLEKVGKVAKPQFVKEVWRIVSERIRIFHSVFVKAVNALRGRMGVLVQNRYKRYYFESKEEWEDYFKKMEGGEEIKSQRNGMYGVGLWWKKLVDWREVRGKKWVESTEHNEFHNYVVRKLINKTLSAHSPPP